MDGWRKLPRHSSKRTGDFHLLHPLGARRVRVSMLRHPRAARFTLCQSLRPLRTSSVPFRSRQVAVYSTLASQLWAGAGKTKTLRNLCDGGRLAPVPPTENRSGALRDRRGPALATVVLHRSKIEKGKLLGLAGLQICQACEVAGPGDAADDLDLGRAAVDEEFDAVDET
jgi:hypothetical protein